MKTKQAFRVLCGTALAATAALAAVPAFAQSSTDSSASISSDASVTAPTKNVLAGNHVTIGVGVAYTPSYDGSNNMSATPFPAIQAHLWGIDVNPRPGGVSLDLIPSPDDAKVSFNLGPVATYTGNRASGSRTRWCARRASWMSASTWAATRA
ncbi:MipA/OmpV family protein [Novosphingobium sp. 9]|uniref:MipA/OmpV family protein n=1 Tax=Novosphingobium sp. 9 TaxID=2025349 RepID=UPI0021B56E65|nr:MipA/OmpV family protein [Novosphingobium sp. 9]